MTDYREQAIKDFSVWSGFPSPTVLALLDVNPTVRYAVAQREARLRLEETMDKIKLLAEASELVGDSIPAVTSRTLLPLIRAALDAVREK